MSYGQSCQVAAKALLKSVVLLTSLTGISGASYLTFRILQAAAKQLQENLEATRDIIRDNLQYSVLFTPNVNDSHSLQTECYLNFTALSQNQTLWFPSQIPNNQTDCTSSISGTDAYSSYLILQILFGVTALMVPSFVYCYESKQNQHDLLENQSRQSIKNMVLSALPSIIIMSTILLLNGYEFLARWATTSVLKDMLTHFCQSTLPILPSNNSFFQECGKQNGTFYLNNASAIALPYSANDKITPRAGFVGLELAAIATLLFSAALLPCALHFILQCVQYCREFKAIDYRIDRDQYEPILDPNSHRNNNDDDDDNDDVEAAHTGGTPMRSTGSNRSTQ